MDKRIRALKINEAVTLLDDHGESTCCLVAGETRALLIHTANGRVDEQRSAGIRRRRR